MRPVWLLCAIAAMSVAVKAQSAPPGASSCSGCHAPHPGQGAVMPPIAGRPAPEITEAMAAFRAGERPGTVMTPIARGFSPEETLAIAEWLERQR
ncbi:c-type cytochrome [Enterovirga sp. CN4-39]|uniref:c-type cytochrome n=1 Tax=Enterovirga sp. CN4-39 TaxID=3400910 RepID=UPI003C041FD4